MPPDFQPATPELLAEAPELATLEILACASDAAARALLGANPDLREHDFLLEHAGVTPQLCLGAALLSTIDALAVAAERYRAHLEQLASRRELGAVKQDF